MLPGLFYKHFHYWLSEQLILCENICKTPSLPKLKTRELKFWEKVHHPNHFTCHVAHVPCHIWHVACHVSCVTCHVSQVMCQNFYLIFLGRAKVVGVSRWRVCYQWGLHRLVNLTLLTRLPRPLPLFGQYPKFISIFKMLPLNESGCKKSLVFVW